MLRIFTLMVFTCCSVAAQPNWQKFSVGQDVSLRGLAAVSESLCWTSGNQGKVLRTTDAGKTWSDVSPEGYNDLDFRDIEALNDSTALILSAGLPAVILRTTDAGNTWNEVYRNETEGVFFDAMDFWDSQTGMAFSDASGRRLLLIRTSDAGKSWEELPRRSSPKVPKGQGGFAASGTCLRTFGNSGVAIGLGGEEASVWISHNRGKKWQKSLTPLDAGEPSKGVFSVHILENGLGYAVGGDYRADSLTNMSIALTTDQGKSWFALFAPEIQGKYRSCVLMLNEDQILITSRTGSNVSLDAGQNWVEMEGGFYTLSEGTDGSVWASGPDGRVAKLRWE